MSEPDPAAFSALDRSVDDRVLTLTLNRPDELNSFTPTIAPELVHAFNRASVDDSVRAVVITGAGLWPQTIVEYVYREWTQEPVPRYG